MPSHAQILAVIAIFFSMACLVASIWSHDAMLIGSGVGLGFWLSAGWLWLTDPATVHPIIP